MKLIALFFKNPGKSEVGLLLIMFLRSMAHLGLLVLINSAVDRLWQGDPLTYHYGLVALALLAAAIVLDHRFAFASARWTGHLVKKLQLQMIDKLRRMELLRWESVKNTEVEEDLGKERIFHTISSETVVLTTALEVLTHTLEEGLVIFLGMIYLAWLSPSMVFFLALTFVAMALIFKRNLLSIRQGLYEERQQRTRFIGKIREMLEGFKEIKVSDRKSDDLFQNSVIRCLKTIRDLDIRMQKKYLMNKALCNYLFFIYLIGFAFFLPSLTASQVHSMTAFATIIFLLGSFIAMIEALPILENAHISLTRLENLESKLVPDQTEETMKDGRLRFPQGKPVLNRLQIQALQFKYPEQGDAPPFEIGPLNFDVVPGEAIFIVGDNGSGKTTLLKLLTGLYPPTSGKIMLDQHQVSPWYYRSLFSVIFSDFHLFDRLYGLDAVKKEEVDGWLKVMKLEFETGLVDNQFDNLRLSTGQRKRLAMIVALMEDKPIYVFDEWAADQAPGFRDYFYQNLIQELKSQGKAVIAITHDDHYFHLADRIYRLQDGQLHA